MNINKYNYLYSGTARRAFEPTAPAFAATYGCHHTDILFNRLCSFVFSTAIVRTISGATSSRSLAQEANFGHQRPRHQLQLLIRADNGEKLSQPFCDFIF